MGSKVFTDESVVPNEQLVFSIIGEKILLWRQMMSYLYGNNKDISEAWKILSGLHSGSLKN
jgi:hypothetical protein